MLDLIYKFITDAGIKAFNDTERSFTAWASRSSMDRDDEEIDAYGWITKDFRKNPVVPLFHNYWQFPVAKSLWEKAEPKEKPIGLLFKPQFAETALGQEAYYLYKEGYMNAFSVGFDPLEWMDSDGEIHSREKDGMYSIWAKSYIEQKKKKPRCRFLKQILLEISGVLVPAHPDALVEARSLIHTPELSRYIDDMIERSRKPMITNDRDYKKTVSNKPIVFANQDDIKDFMIMDLNLQKRYIDVIRKLSSLAGSLDDTDKDLINQLYFCAFELNDLWNYAGHKSENSDKKADTIDASEFDDDHEIDIELDDDLEIEITQEDDIEVELETLVEV